MGDAYLLNDRDGVRTPMQWNGEPDAGFSTADPAMFYLPLVTDPGYEAAEVNVAVQQSRDGSLLRWVRDLLAARRSLPVLGTGGFEFVDTGDMAVLGYRRFEAEAEAEVAILANFSTTWRSVPLPRPMIDLRSGQPFSGSLELSANQFRWLGPDE